MRWVYYGVALLATIAAGCLWVFVLWEVRDVQPVPVAVVSPPVTPPAPPRARSASKPVPSACINGEAWALFGQQWVKLRDGSGAVVPCGVRTGGAYLTQ